VEPGTFPLFSKSVLIFYINFLHFHHLIFFSVFFRSPCFLPSLLLCLPPSLPSFCFPLRLVSPWWPEQVLTACSQILPQHAVFRSPHGAHCLAKRCKVGFCWLGKEGPDFVQEIDVDFVSIVFDYLFIILDCSISEFCFFCFLFESGEMGCNLLTHSHFLFWFVLSLEPIVFYFNSLLKSLFTRVWRGDQHHCLLGW
jgi:hypothetical protein